MPICGVVLTLDPLPDGRARAIRALRDHSHVTVGELYENRLPVVFETDTFRADTALWEWLSGVDGVIRWDVVYAHIGAVADAAVEEAQAQ